MTKLTHYTSARGIIIEQCNVNIGDDVMLPIIVIIRPITEPASNLHADAIIETIVCIMSLRG